MSEELSFRVEPELANAFRRYCADQGFKPYSLLGEIVRGYARSQLALEAMKEGRMTEAGALEVVAALVKDFERMAKINGTFRQIAIEAAAKFGVNLQSYLL